MKKSLVICLALSGLSFCVSAQTFNVNVIANSTTGLFLDSGGNSLTGTSVEFGLFDESSFNILGPTQQLDFSQIDSLFTSLGAVSTNVSGEVFSLGNTVPTSSAPAGSQLYLLVSNAAVASNASEFGIFGSSFYTAPNADGTVSLTSSLIDNVVLGSSSGASPSDYRLAAVPEPSSFALLAGVFGLAWVMVRRRA